MTITGILKHKFDAKIFPGKQGAGKREFAVLYKGDKPDLFMEPILFTIVDNAVIKCADLDKFDLEEFITVHFNIKGREWKSPNKGTMYFNTLQVWKLEK